MTVVWPQASVTQQRTLWTHKTKGMGLGRSDGSRIRPWNGSFHPPSRQTTRTSIDHHHPTGSRPKPVGPAKDRNPTRMGMGTTENNESQATAPALGCDLLEWIQCESSLPGGIDAPPAVRLIIHAPLTGTPDIAAGPDHAHSRIASRVPQEKGTAFLWCHRKKRPAQNDQAIAIEAQPPWHLRRLADKVSVH